MKKLDGFVMAICPCDSLLGIAAPGYFISPNETKFVCGYCGHNHTVKFANKIQKILSKFKRNEYWKNYERLKALSIKDAKLAKTI